MPVSIRPGSVLLVLQQNKADYPSTAKVFLKVITGEPENVKTLLAETEPVTLSIRNGVINSFEGTVSRPIVETKMSPTSVLIAMAAAGTQDNKILLR